jgi:hypothetical protein
MRGFDDIVCGLKAPLTLIGDQCLRAMGTKSMIEDAVARLQAIEQALTEKTSTQLQARLTIRGCLKELRVISGGFEPPAETVDGNGAVRMQSLTVVS